MVINGNARHLDIHESECKFENLGSYRVDLIVDLIQSGYLKKRLDVELNKHYDLVASDNCDLIGHLKKSLPYEILKDGMMCSFRLKAKETDDKGNLKRNYIPIFDSSGNKIDSHFWQDEGKVAQIRNKMRVQVAFDIVPYHMPLMPTLHKVGLYLKLRGVILMENVNYLCLFQEKSLKKNVLYNGLVKY